MLLENITRSVTEAASSLGRENRMTATDQVARDGAALRFVAHQKRNVSVDKTKGWGLEGCHVMSFNRQAARAGSPLRAVWTHLTNCHDPADIRIVDGERIVDEVQAKANTGSSSVVNAFRKDHYDGMKPLCLEDELAGARDYASIRPMNEHQQHVHDNLTDRLDYDGIQSDSISRQQAETVSKTPGAKRTTYSAQATEIGREIGGAARNGALAAGAFTSATTIFTNTRAVRRGDINTQDAIRDTAKRSSLAAAKGGFTAGGAAGISVLARQASLTAKFAKGSGPAALMTVGVEVGLLARRHRRGEISRHELEDGIAILTASTTAGVYGAVIGQALIPVPVLGALVGSIVASTIASALASNLTQLRHRADQQIAELELVAKANADRAAAKRAELDQITAAHASQHLWIQTLIDDLAVSLTRGDVANSLQAVGDLQQTLNVTGRPADEMRDRLLDPTRPLSFA